MTFTSGAADHQHAHGEKSRKFFTNRINQPPWPARNSFHQILLHKKKGWMPRILPVRSRRIR